jgi:beta-lactam-binding protein with PASTA domain
VVGAAPDTVAVPNVVGLDEQRARDTLRQNGFTSITVDRVDSAKAKGEVIGVDPAETTQVAPSATITLSVSDGDTAIPDVTGQDVATATKNLRAAGFTNIATADVDSDKPQGTVVGTSPAQGNQASADTQITLQVSGGVAQIKVPDVVNQTADVARKRLEAAGFTNITVTTSDQPAAGVTPGNAIGTTPPAGSTQAPDAAISLLIAPPAG